MPPRYLININRKALKLMKMRKNIFNGSEYDIKMFKESLKINY